MTFNLCSCALVTCAQYNFMKLLIVTNLFPNAQEPNRATFNFQQFSALSRLCELKVVAPVPYFYKPPHRHPEPSREMLSAFPGQKPPKSLCDFWGQRGEGSPKLSTCVWRSFGPLALPGLSGQDRQDDNQGVLKQLLLIFSRFSFFLFLLFSFFPTHFLLYG